MLPVTDWRLKEGKKIEEGDIICLKCYRVLAIYKTVMFQPFHLVKARVAAVVQVGLDY